VLHALHFLIAFITDLCRSRWPCMRWTTASTCQTPKSTPSCRRDGVLSGFCPSAKSMQVSWISVYLIYVLALMSRTVDANQCNDESGPSLGIPGRGAQVPHAMATGTRSTAKKRTSPLNYGCSRSSPSMWMQGRTLEEIQAGMRQFLLHQPLPVARSAPGNLESKVYVVG
jgi:hypothetical protein